MNIYYSMGIFNCRHFPYLTIHITYSNATDSYMNIALCKTCVVSVYNARYLGCYTV